MIVATVFILILNQNGSQFYLYSQAKLWLYDHILFNLKWIRNLFLWTSNKPAFLIMQVLRRFSGFAHVDKCVYSYIYLCIYIYLYICTYIFKYAEEKICFKYLIFCSLEEKYALKCCSVHTDEFFRNHIKSNWNRIVLTIFRLISVWFNKIPKRFICV